MIMKLFILWILGFLRRNKREKIIKVEQFGEMVKSRDGDGFGLEGKAEWMTELTYTMNRF